MLTVIRAVAAEIDQSLGSVQEPQRTELYESLYVYLYNALVVDRLKVLSFSVSLADLAVIETNQIPANDDRGIFLSFELTLDVHNQVFLTRIDRTRKTLLQGLRIQYPDLKNEADHRAFLKLLQEAAVEDLRKNRKRTAPVDLEKVSDPDSEQPSPSPRKKAKTVAAGSGGRKRRRSMSKSDDDSYNPDEVGSESPPKKKPKKNETTAAASGGHKRKRSMAESDEDSSSADEAESQSLPTKKIKNSAATELSEKNKGTTSVDSHKDSSGIDQQGTQPTRKKKRRKSECIDQHCVIYYTAEPGASHGHAYIMPLNAASNPLKGQEMNLYITPIRNHVNQQSKLTQHPLRITRKQGTIHFCPANIGKKTETAVISKEYLEAALKEHGLNWRIEEGPPPREPQYSSALRSNAGNLPLYYDPEMELVYSGQFENKGVRLDPVKQRIYCQLSQTFPNHLTLPIINPRSTHTNLFLLFLEDDQALLSQQPIGNAWQNDQLPEHIAEVLQSYGFPKPTKRLITRKEKTAFQRKISNQQPYYDPVQKVLFFNTPVEFNKYYEDDPLVPFKAYLESITQQDGAHRSGISVFSVFQPIAEQSSLLAICRDDADCAEPLSLEAAQKLCELCKFSLPVKIASCSISLPINEPVVHYDIKVNRNPFKDCQVCFDGTRAFIDLVSLSALEERSFERKYYYFASQIRVPNTQILILEWNEGNIQLRFAQGTCFTTENLEAALLVYGFEKPLKVINQSVTQIPQADRQVVAEGADDHHSDGASAAVMVVSSPVGGPALFDVPSSLTQDRTQTPGDRRDHLAPDLTSSAEVSLLPPDAMEVDDQDKLRDQLHLRGAK